MTPPRTAPRLLIADPDKAIRRLLRLTAHKQGCHCDEVSTITDLADGVSERSPDVLLLDLSLGKEACAYFIAGIRQWSTLPILVLSVDTDEALKVRMLDAGADDYITKPFNIEELMARVRAAQRRNVLSMTSQYDLRGDISVDWARRIVKRDDEFVHLTPTEYRIFELLARNPSATVTHQQILDDIRGDCDEASSQLLRVHVRNLRTKLEDDPSQPKYITTIPGIGYRFCNPHSNSHSDRHPARDYASAADTPHPVL